MAQPIWITPTGSLGVVPEGVFYQQALSAVVTPIGSPIIVSATTAGTNLITCSSTAGVKVGQLVQFSGTNFGGLQENIGFYVLTVNSSTTFTITANSASTVPVSLTTATGYMLAVFYERVYYQLIAGTLPQGVQIGTSGVITGVPQAVINLQGVPTEVSRDVTSKFAIRAYTLNDNLTVDRIADRTFTLTITGNDVPQFVTPAGSVGTYYDGDYVSVQIDYTGTDPNETVTIRKVAGTLPIGTTISSTGLISGYIQPAPNEDEPVGYDLTPIGLTPYDFIISAISRNYQFTLEITDGKSNNLRTYTIFVYNRNDLTGDNTTITTDTTFVTADETTERAPFLVNFEPSNLGIVRSDNYYAYRFVGQDFDTEQFEYVLSVAQGTGLPPGLILDRYTGWYYGYIPDQGVTEIEYGFNIQVRARSMVCTATEASTDLITCDATARADLYVGAQVIFEGTTFGNISAGNIYYVHTIASDTQFSISTTIAGAVFPLSDAVGEMLGVPKDIPSSIEYPFTLTITGAIDQEVTWLTDANLGSIENGATSLFSVSAVNRGNRQLYYRLASGEFNQLPQGLTLLPSGDIAGRASFNTFSIDLGETTFDASQSLTSGLEETTFDMTFVFTVNAYATDPTQLIYEVANVTVINGGSGYSSGNTSPVVEISGPLGGIQSEQAEVGSVTVFDGKITAVNLSNNGAGYGNSATATVTQGYGGIDAEFEVVMALTGEKEIVSVNKTFTIKLVRAYNKPYQNLFVLAMPPQNDRALLHELLDNPEIFIPDYIFRPTDPNFGLSERVEYQHAFGLAPDTFETYVESLYFNHYWKNLVLGEINTAQALDENNNVIYEVVYSRVVDDLTNNAGESVAKIVNLPYAITLPGDTRVSEVYPNSLVNMRDQVIDVVGQISTKLPLWMTSKQSDGRVLGFTPAWVICYTKPGRSKQIAYYLNTYFGQQLNRVDFKVDRYVLDATLSKNWSAADQNWTPEPSLTTFDRINTTGYTDLGTVSACTELAYSDVNGRTVDYINALGGLDGATWVAVSGQTPPEGTQVVIRNGSTIAFVKQENYNDPPGSVSAAWSDYIVPFDDAAFDSGTGVATEGSFDYAPLVPGGLISICSATSATTDFITCDTTINMSIGDKVYFTGTTFGNIEDETGLGLTKVYYVLDINSKECTATSSSTDRITCSNTSGLTIGDLVWFSGSVFGNIEKLLADGSYRPYYIADIPITGVNGQIQISDTPGGTPIALTSSSNVSPNNIIAGLQYTIDTVGSTDWNVVAGTTGIVYEIGDEFVAVSAGTGTGVAHISSTFSMNLGGFQVTETLDGTTPVALSTDTGTMTVHYANYRMGIYTVTIDTAGVFSLTLSKQTVTNDYITSTQGAKYAGGTYLYRPAAAVGSLTRINWQPLITATTVVSDETTFDLGSLQFIEPVDMYDPTDTYDKYLVFPKTNILA